MSLQHVLHLVIAFISLSALPASTYAQITLDGSLGPAGSLSGPNYTISSSFGQTRGANLFHSFGLFNILTGQSATFTGPNSISNIISRVTGGQRSTIDGRLASTIPGAHLYLLNPAGVLFGPNALLDVQGSFHVSTADYLKFTDGAKFHADLSKQSVLTSAPVSAFGFLSQNLAGITTQGSSLQVPSGQTLSIVSGDINIGGSLSVPAGKIQLASLAASGEAPLNLQDMNLSDFPHLGAINLNSASLTASGNGGGSVMIRGGQLVFNGSNISTNNLGSIDGTGTGVDIGGESLRLTNGSFIQSSMFGSGHGRSVQVTADTITMDGAFPTGIFADAETGSRGDAGRIIANAKNVTVKNGAQIRSDTFSSGNAGTVTVTASETVNLAGTGSGIFVDANSGTGNAGGVEITSKNVSVTNGALIRSATFTSGNAGIVTVTASDTVNVAGTGSGINANAFSGSTGNAGEVEITSKNVSVTAAARIRSSTFGLGQGGSVHVTASDTITLDGASPTGIFADAESGSRGDAGRITAEAKNITVRNGASIRSATFSSGNAGTVTVAASESVNLAGAGTGIFVYANSGSTGNAGDVEITSKNVSVTGGAQILSSTFGPGQGGSVQVTATDTITLADPATGMFADAVSSGYAGNIIVNAKNVTLTNGAEIRSDTFGSGSGGTVQVSATDSITMDGAIPARISADAVSSGDAGNLMVNAKNVTLTNGAEIRSISFGSGHGGTVQVSASESVAMDGASSTILAEAQSTGDAGNVIVNAKNVTLTNGAEIRSDALSAGNAGNIIVNATDLTVTNGALIDSEIFGSGHGGTIQVRATDTASLTGGSRIFADSSTGSTGDAGNIIVEAKNVTLSSGTISSSTFGPGNGGTITVAATDTVTLTRTSSSARFNPGIFAQTSSTSGGDAGNIVVEAKNVTVSDGAAISSSTHGSGKGGNITVKTSDTVNLAGASSTGDTSGIFASALTGSTGEGGSIVVEAKNVTLSDGAQIGSNTFAVAKAGTVTVTATDTVNLTGSRISNDTFFASGIFASAATGSTGDAGGIVVEAKNVTVSNGAQITSDARAAGKGGSITVKASDTLNLVGASSTGQITRILADAITGSTSDAGNIVIEAKNVTLSGGAEITSTTKGPGTGGSITVKASDTVNLAGTNSSGSSSSGILATAFTGSTGEAGSIILEARNVTLSGGAIITSGTFGLGHGGTVTVTASDTVNLTGASSGIFARAETGSTANAGGLSVKANNVLVTGGARISSSTFGPGNGGTVTINATETVALDGANVADATGIFSQAGAGSAGNANNILVEAKNVSLTAGAQISSSTFGSGRGGTVMVKASDTFRLNDHALISAISSGSGNAGDIFIGAREFHSVDSSVSTQADFADGGNIHMTVGKIVNLFNSEITATVKSGVGQGGNVTIDPTFVILNHSHISANAFGGPGGNMGIIADVFLASPDSSVTASSALSTQGTVNIQAPVTNLSGTLAPLPESVFQATSLLQQSCATRFSGGKLSSLVLGSRDGLPLEPGGFMPSPLYRIDSSPNPLALLDRIEVRIEGPTPALLASAKPHFSLNWRCTK